MAMQITLPPEAQAIVDREIESGRYESVEAVVVQALYQLDDVSFVDDELLVEARAQADRGETRELTEEVWAEIRERAINDCLGFWWKGNLHCHLDPLVLPPGCWSNSSLCAHST